MASALSVTTNCCPNYQEVRSPSAELDTIYPFVEEGEAPSRNSDTRGKTYEEEQKPEFGSTKADKLVSSITQKAKHGIYNFAGRGLDVEVEPLGLSSNIQMVYVDYETEPPVYVENGSIVVELERLEVHEQYRVIIDNVRYTVFKNEEGEIAIGVSPPHD